MYLIYILKIMKNTFEDDLLNLCNHLNQNGFKFLLSNSYNDYILDKFKDFSIDTIKRFDCMKNLKNRSNGLEVLIYN